MIKWVIECWDNKKDVLKEYITTHNINEYASTYEQLVTTVVNTVLNSHDKYTFVTDEMVVIDHGDYQGTQIFILHLDTYQPGVEDYIFTNNYYGSCSGCDALQRISDYSDDHLPNEEQVDDFMLLCLGLIQSFQYMIPRGEDK